MVSQEPLWWPPNRLCGRYLAPYLSRQVGFAADVMPDGDTSAGDSSTAAELHDLEVLRELAPHEP